MIKNLKEYPNAGSYSKQINDQLHITVYPDGRRMDRTGFFQYAIMLSLFPMNISRLKVRVRTKAILGGDNMVHQQHNIREIYYDKIRTPFYRFINGNLKDDLSFEGEIVILELYDLKGNIIPKNKWIDYNVHGILPK